MTEGAFIKNITFAEPQVILDLMDYQEDQVISRTFAQNSVMSLTLVTFDQGQCLSAHTAAGDAFVQILDGEAQITIDGKKVIVKSGEIVVMPAKVPHSLHAATRFKMLPAVVKGN